MSDDPCWEGYEQRGTKEKEGRTVPNCVKSDADRMRELEWRADCLKARMDALTGETRADGGVSKNIFNGDRYVKLEMVETGGSYPDNKYKIVIGSRTFGTDLSFREAQAKMREVETQESRPVPKKVVSKGPGYQSEMSVFFPRVKR